jgi:serine protease Do
MFTSRHSRFRIQFISLSMFALAASAFAQPDKISGSFSEVVKRVEPAVVSIDTKGRVAAQPVARGTPQPGDSSDIMEFFRRQMPQQRQTSSVGSGFIVDKAGYIITNAHVIEEASRITVRLDSGEEYNAAIVGSDEETDIAVLKINVPRDLPAVKFGDSDKAEVGDWVLTIGSPFNLAKTVSAGIISQIKRETPYATAFQKFIQTDAVINPGNSGGPLVNTNGEVIGVNSQIATSTGEYNGVGFALPSTEAAYVYAQIVSYGRVRRGYLGAFLDSVKVEFAKVYGLKEPKGAIITEIRDKRGPAALAGLQVGDVVLDFNGKPVENATDLIARIAVTPPDQTVNVGVVRENGETLERKTIATKLGERPIRGGANGENPDRRTMPVDREPTKPFGLTLSELTSTMADQFRLTGLKGLLVESINPTSFITDVTNQAGSSALRPGDLIQRINRKTVTDLKSFETIVSGLKAGDPVVLHVAVYSPNARAPITKIVQFTVK